MRESIINICFCYIDTRESSRSSNLKHLYHASRLLWGAEDIIKKKTPTVVLKEGEWKRELLMSMKREQ